jgi:hypothetical protein
MSGRAPSYMGGLASDHVIEKPLGSSANRLQFGQWNYAEAGTPDAFGAWETALRAGASEFNTGQVYVTPPSRGGVKNGDEGILKTHTVLYYGIVRAGIEQRYNGYPVQNQTVLDQWAGTPTRYDGDVPLDLAWSPTGPAPWLKATTSR